MNLEQDFKLCCGVINGYSNNKIYRNTNELLTKILNSEDIKDKDVLTVLASSDQLFSAHYLQAKSVDSFDQNILAYYYFFLRKWCMLYTGKYYIPAKNEELLKAIELKNSTKEEIDAYIFWRNILVNLNVPLYYSNLFYRMGINWAIPFDNDYNFMKSIDNITPNFYHYDMFKNIESNKKYDVIIMSNIIEYIGRDEKTLEDVKNLKNNLLKLLNDDGIIIASNLLDYNENNILLEDTFTYIEGEVGNDYKNNRKKVLSYKLKRR